MSRLKEPKAVLFDFYATLIDIKTDDDDQRVWDGVAGYVSQTAGPVDSGALRHAYESRLRLQLSTSAERHPEVQVTDAMRDALLEMNEHVPGSVVDPVVRVFRSLSMRRFRTFSDTIPVLEHLRKRYRLGLVCDGQRVFFQDELDRAGLSAMFEVVVCSSDHPFHKPDVRMFQIALDVLGLAPGDTVHVGDSLDRDMVGCRRAGLTGILLDRGGNYSGPPDKTDGPHVVIGSLSDLRYLFSQ